MKSGQTMTGLRSKEGSMKKEEVYRDMKETLGLVPSFFKTVPDSALELEWKLLKRVQMEPG